jgi:hypothetical protein
MVGDIQRRKAPATARLDHLGMGVWKVVGFDPPKPAAGSPARPSRGEEKACGVAARPLKKSLWRRQQDRRRRPSRSSSWKLPARAGNTHRNCTFGAGG